MLAAKQKELDTVAAREKWSWSHKLAQGHKPISSLVPLHYQKKGQKGPEAN